MKIALQLDYLWHDNDVLEIGVSASNGNFAGKTSTYISIDGLGIITEKIKGFPHDRSDVREVQFGSPGKESAGGFVSIRLACMDGPGHSVAEILFEDKNSGSRWHGPTQTAHFFAQFEAAALDEFVVQLQQLEECKHGAAVLKFQEQNL